MVNFERITPSEEIDSADIVRGLLKVQASFATEQNRPLGRATHTKGVCARATFEIFDIAHKISDHSLARQLSHGLFAKPGTYPATVRFANAASTIYKDRKPDLRALSFSVELPPDLGAATPFQDYSMQSNPTFPINDARTFAVLMKVLSAGTPKEQMKALWSLSFFDTLRFAKAALTGFLQEQGKIRPYQTIRYWSTVPFRHGPFEAAKFSVIPASHNRAHALQDEPDAMRDELIRHLDEDDKMSSFDFAVQLLDTQKMTRWGFHRQASFWVENASVEWKQAQAPFHVIGRLTLIAKSALEATACEPRFIDVTAHSTPDSQPLGSINRARRISELASRRVRTGEATAEEVLESLPTAPPVPHSRLRGLLRFAAVAFVLWILLYFSAALIYDRLAATSNPPLEQVDAVRYLNQGWGLDRESPDRELFYYTAQGSGIHGIRYSWFVNLERPFHRVRFSDPDHMRSLNFIVDPAATPKNPDQLPVGFARRYDDSLKDSVIDITCSACHTGQLNVTSKDTGQTTAIRIDGGEAMSAFTDVNPGSFQLELGGSVAETLVNPLKFNRFARRVLGPDSNTLSAKLKLWRNLSSVSLELGKTFLGSSWYRRYPVKEGFGRTDALTRIGNVVFGDHITSANYHQGSGPVSYPYLWNIWKFNWVQYSASVSQPMARNVSEAMGVGADFKFFDDYGRPLPVSERYRTTVQFDNLARIEATLQKLKPPRWPEDLLGAVKQDSAAHGQQLFEQHCVGCHGPHVAASALRNFASPGRLPNDPMWDIRTIDDVGTDPTAASNFYNYRIDLTRTGLTFDEVSPILKTEMEIQRARYELAMPALDKEIAAGIRPGVDEAMLKDYATQQQEMKDNPVTEETIAQQLGSLNLRSLNAGDALNMVGMIIRHKYYDDNHIAGQTKACFAGFDTLDIPDLNNAYKPRPLEGVWATPPFLHNGSVPNIYELLSPIEERTKVFYVGRHEYDPLKLGYLTRPADGSKRGFWLDTSQPGNLNIGHQFREGYVTYNPDPNAPKSPVGIIGPPLSPSDRMDIIEYLKVHRDSPGTPERTPIDCIAMLK